MEEVKKEEGSSLSDVMSLQNDAGETALYIAAENNLQEIFSFLLSMCDFELLLAEGIHGESVGDASGDAGSRPGSP